MQHTETRAYRDSQNIVPIHHPDDLRLMGLDEQKAATATDALITFRCIRG